MGNKKYSITKEENITSDNSFLRYNLHSISSIIRNVATITEKRKTAVWIAGCLAVATLDGCSAGARKNAEATAQAEYVFSYAENQPEDYPTTKGAQYFADLVKTRSDGRILIQVEAGGALGDEDSVVSQLAYGGIDFGRISATSLTQDVPELQILMLPYLYRDESHMWTVLDGKTGTYFLDKIQGTGMKALSWYDAGARSFYTMDHPVRTPEDMKGLVIRTQKSEIMKELVLALGAEPRESVYSEVNEMLELHEIDGAENNLASYMAGGHYQLAKYYTVDEHSRIPEIQLISEETWNQLDEQDQALILECAKESALYERSLWSEYEDHARQVAEASGCQIIELTEEERNAFQEKSADIYESYFPDQEDLIYEIQAAR